mmetsp:Transcript_7470/g.22096  ORF Transcript_7470/g.22096 Transcript_7470/m.22096 type:complete len:228 (-) Transcript_7470:2996-3679(-)
MSLWEAGAPSSGGLLCRRRRLEGSPWSRLPWIPAHDPMDTGPWMGCCGATRSSALSTRRKPKSPGRSAQPWRACSPLAASFRQLAVTTASGLLPRALRRPCPLFQPTWPPSSGRSQVSVKRMPSCQTRRAEFQTRRRARTITKATFSQETIITRQEAMKHPQLVHHSQEGIVLAVRSIVLTSQGRQAGLGSAGRAMRSPPLSGPRMHPRIQTPARSQSPLRVSDRRR